MGYRTIIVLDNDDTNLWGDDPLGKAITSASGKKISNLGGEIMLEGNQIGTIIDCEHADIESLVHFSSLSGTVLAKNIHNSRVSEQELRENMLKEIASSMGFTLVKNTPEVKNPEVTHTLYGMDPPIKKFSELNEGQIDFANGIINSAIIVMYLENGIDRLEILRMLGVRSIENVFNEMYLEDKDELISIIEQDHYVDLILPKSLEETKYVDLVEVIVGMLGGE